MADSGAGGAGGGMMIFTLWYIGIAYLYYTEHYEKKSEEGTQTHTSSENSSQHFNKSPNILEQAVDILEEHVEMKLAAVAEPDPVPKPKLEPEREPKTKLEPEREPKPKLEPEPEPKPKLEPERELKPKLEPEPEPKPNVELEPELKPKLEHVPADEIISLVKSPADVQSDSDFEEAADSDNIEPVATLDTQDEENFD